LCVAVLIGPHGWTGAVALRVAGFVCVVTATAGRVRCTVADLPSATCGATLGFCCARTGLTAATTGRVLRVGIALVFVVVVGLGLGFAATGADRDPDANAFALSLSARLASLSCLACSRFLRRSCFFFSCLTQASSRASCFLARRAFSFWILSRSSPYVNVGCTASHAFRVFRENSEGGSLGGFGR